EDAFRLGKGAAARVEGAGLAGMRREAAARRRACKQLIDFSAETLEQRLLESDAQARRVRWVEHAEGAARRLVEELVVGLKTEVDDAAGGQALDEAGLERGAGAVVERLQALLE